MRIAGSLPLFPQRFIVSGETRSNSATSLTVRRSGSSLRLTFFFFFFPSGSIELLIIV